MAAKKKATKKAAAAAPAATVPAKTRGKRTKRAKEEVPAEGTVEASQKEAAPEPQEPQEPQEPPFRPEDYDAMLHTLRSYFSGEVDPSLEELAAAALSACTTIELTSQMVVSLREERDEALRLYRQGMVLGCVERDPSDVELEDELAFEVQYRQGRKVVAAGEAARV